MNIDPEDIEKFQEDIGTDNAVILDVPVPQVLFPDANTLISLYGSNRIQPYAIVPCLMPPSKYRVASISAISFL